MKVKLTTMIGLMLFCVLISSSVLAQDFSVDAEVGLLYDYDSAQVLFSQAGESRWIPASLVKIMTMYVALDRLAIDNIPYDHQVTVSERAWQMGGSQMFLEVGDQVSIEELLYGIAVVSGNDACVALSEALAGTEALFVQWMNQKAESLGLALHFADVHGLSEQNQITAHDYAILVANYLSDHPDALKYHSELSFGYQPRSSANPIVQSNRNRLLRSYEGTDGLKTGFLSKSGYNLIATAKQNDRRLIAIILGAESESRREQEARKLLDYGFRSFEIINANEFITDNLARVYKGRENYVEFSAVVANVTVVRGTRDQFVTEIEFQRLEAPIQAGDELGTLSFIKDEEVLKTVSLIANETVERGNWFTVLIDTIVLFFNQLFTSA